MQVEKTKQHKQIFWKAPMGPSLTLELFLDALGPAEVMTKL